MSILVRENSLVKKNGTPDLLVASFRLGALLQVTLAILIRDSDTLRT